MTTPHALYHALLRPCILHILRAAGYHSTRPSVLDTLTDLAARYIVLLAQTAADHASLNHNEPELAVEVSLQDVRMAMQDCGLLLPEKILEEQEFEGVEDTRGVDGFIAWATGPGNKEIRRVALDGVDGTKDDYLTALKKKHSTADEDSRYNGTVLGKPTEHNMIKVEGSDITSIKEWVEILKKSHETSPVSAMSSRRQSSALSSLGDESMGSMEF